MHENCHWVECVRFVLSISIVAKWFCLDLFSRRHNGMQALDCHRQDEKVLLIFARRKINWIIIRLKKLSLRFATFTNANDIGQAIDCMKIKLMENNTNNQHDSEMMPYGMHHNFWFAKNVHLSKMHGILIWHPREENRREKKCTDSVCLFRPGCECDGRTAATARRQCLVYSSTRTMASRRKLLYSGCCALSELFFLFTIFDARHICERRRRQCSLHSSDCCKKFIFPASYVHVYHCRCTNTFAQRPHTIDAQKQ